MTVSETPAPHCCYIGCDQWARWEIIPKSEKPWHAVYTMACTAHVGALCTEVGSNTVYRLREDGTVIMRLGES